MKAQLWKISLSMATFIILIGCGDFQNSDFIQENIENSQEIQGLDNETNHNASDMKMQISLEKSPQLQSISYCNGEAFTTIQAAIDDAPDYSTIKLPDGFYTEKFYISDRSGLTIKPCSKNSVILFRPYNENTILISSSTDINIQGFIFTEGSNNNGKAQIDATGNKTTNLKIIQNIFENVKTGLKINYYSNDLLIKYNVFRNIEQGISITDKTQSALQDNIVLGNHSINVLKNNFENTASALQFYGYNPNVSNYFEYSRIIDSNQMIFNEYSSNDPYILYRGIFLNLQGPHQHTTAITNNIISGYEKGISLSHFSSTYADFENFYLINNTFANNGSALYSQYMSNNLSSISMLNNIFIDNDYVWFTENPFDTFPSFHYSLFFNNTSLLGEIRGIRISAYGIKYLSGYANITNQDPMLDSNLRLKQGSPCINTGTSSPLTPSHDIDNNPRPLYNNYDIGASEYKIKISKRSS
ncbi:MAG: choice-of-anchor Q domain-containing protein [Pseudomonadota bacterium]